MAGRIYRPAANYSVHQLWQGGLITETTKKAVEVKPVTFLASSKTQKHLRAEAGTSSQTITNADPWQDVDPWMSWRPTSTEAPPPKSTSGKSHLAEVTGQLREELQASFRKELDEFKQNQDATMQDTAAPATEDRFRRLETTHGGNPSTAEPIQPLVYSSWPSIFCYGECHPDDQLHLEHSSTRASRLAP